MSINCHFNLIISTILSEITTYHNYLYLSCQPVQGLQQLLYPSGHPLQYKVVLSSVIFAQGLLSFVSVLRRITSSVDVLAQTNLQSVINT